MKSSFQEKITPFYECLIDRSNPDDPLGRMLLSSNEELVSFPDECEDPISEALVAKSAGGRLIHRYKDRALLLLTDSCPAHCRFCFRKCRNSYRRGDISECEFSEALEYISGHSCIREIILSGGDPLSIPDERLTEICAKLRESGDLRIRLHSRYPVYDPERIISSPKLGALFDAVMLHVNHSREITPEFEQAVRLLSASCPLFNQAVLLKGVNDSTEEIENLSRKLFAVGVTPAYLHMMDLVTGGRHFMLPLEKAQELIAGLEARIPLFMIPKLILELPGGKGKITLSANCEFRRDRAGDLLFKSPLDGKQIVYPDFFRSQIF